MKSKSLFGNCAGVCATPAILTGALLLCARAETAKPYGLNPQPAAKPYLQMPEQTEGAVFPPLLSQTGAFKDVRSLTPSDGLIPYDLNISFWSDGAAKARWMAAPREGADGRGKIGFKPTGEWTFPKGTVFVKHFELATDETRPDVKRRLETRLLVCDATNGVYGVTYKWRADNSDADLLSTNLTEPITIKTATGTRVQNWYYPNRQDCLTCHTARAGGVLGVKTRQLNRDFGYPGGVTDNELRAWNHAGLFDAGFEEAKLQTYASLAHADDTTRSLEERARSYLDANCAHCHRPGGTVAYFDARYNTPLAQQNLIEGQVLINQGIDNPQTIAPHDIWRSILYMRVNTVEPIKMPPLAHEMLDKQAVTLLRQWIESMPGPPVLEPPAISPRGGDYDKPVEVTIKESEPGVSIHYTLDGSAPTASDPVYEKPIKIEGPTILRAKAYKHGFTRSITVQEVFIIGG